MKWKITMLVAMCWSWVSTASAAFAEAPEQTSVAALEAPAPVARASAYGQAMEKSVSLDSTIDRERRAASRDAELGIYGAALVRYRSIAALIRSDIEQLDAVGVDRNGEAEGVARREQRQRQLDDVKTIVRLLNVP